MIEIKPFCPQCGKPGQVERLKEGILDMFCLTCRVNWQSNTEICPDCGETNGYASPGKCVKCYRKRRGVA